MDTLDTYHSIEVTLRPKGNWEDRGRERHPDPRQQVVTMSSENGMRPNVVATNSSSGPSVVISAACHPRVPEAPKTEAAYSMIVHELGMVVQ